MLLMKAGAQQMVGWNDFIAAKRLQLVALLRRLDFDKALTILPMN